MKDRSKHKVNPPLCYRFPFLDEDVLGLQDVWQPLASHASSLLDLHLALHLWLQWMNLVLIRSCYWTRLVNYWSIIHNYEEKVLDGPILAYFSSLLSIFDPRLSVRFVQRLHWGSVSKKQTRRNTLTTKMKTKCKNYLRESNWYPSLRLPWGSINNASVASHKNWPTWN